MQAISLGDMLDALEDRADLPTLSTSTFITRAMATRWLNESGRKLMGKLVEAYGEGHFATTQTISTVADQDYVALPASETPVITDMYRVLGLRVTLNSERVDLDRADLGDIDMESDNTAQGWTVGRRPKWDFREYIDQRFVWTRTPTAVHTVTVHYVPYFVFVHASDGLLSVGEMSDEDAHYMRSHLGWGEWAILDAAIKAKKHQDLPPTDWQALEMEKGEIEASILGVANKRTARSKHVHRRWRRNRSGGRGQW